MRIPLAAVEPDDLVSIRVSESFTIELRTRGLPFVRNGRRWLEAWATIPEIAAVTSPDDSVELLQRRAGGPGEREPVRHPHGWAITRAESATVHYFEATVSLCGAVIGYGGLCYPSYDASYFAGAFDHDLVRCSPCLASAPSAPGCASSTVAE